MLFRSLLSKRWQAYDTSKTLSKNQYTLDNGGKVVAEGEMSYWESTERYPDDKPEIWGELCGKPIRHHKMPDDSTSHIYNPENNTIVVLGVKFENITHPLDLDGNPIVSIVGYEILRGSREGNRSIIAKGMVNNLRTYNIQGSANNNTTGLYPNYPFNTIDP